MSLAALIRHLIDEHLRANEPSPEDPLDSITGIGQGGGAPIGREHDRHLYGKERA
jgi:hypothetical protein